MDAIQFKIGERTAIIPLNVANACMGSWADNLSPAFINLKVEKVHTSELEKDYSEWQKTKEYPNEDIEYRLVGFGGGKFISYIGDFFRVFTDEECGKLIFVASNVIEAHSNAL
jgi:hypothetical protein